MTIGICCQWLTKKVKPKAGTEYDFNIIEEKSLQLGRYKARNYPDTNITLTYLHNIAEVSKALDIVAASKISHFRLSSGMLPLMDIVDQSVWNNKHVVDALSGLGTKIAALKMRVSTHPGQFTVLSSDTASVVDSAIREIENQSWIFDQMGLAQSPQFSINVHGGKSDREDKLVESIGRLTPGARSRLTLENDESCYSVRQLLKVSERTATPIVFDSHHHTFNEDRLSGKEAAKLAATTWAAGILPIQHLSNTTPGKENSSFTERRQHSYSLHYIPDFQKEMLLDGLVDIEMEFKGKNLGVLPELNKLGINVL
jgi:UV DNA damage repair endonuclease